MHTHRKSPFETLLAPVTIVCLAILLLLPAAVPAQNLPAVTAETSPYGEATIYGIEDKDCAIKLSVFTHETNLGVIKHWSSCPSLWSRHLPFLERIFTEVMNRDRHAASFRTLFWGGLAPEEQRSSWELSLRLALAAHKSDGWDGSRGKPVSGDLHRFVKGLANREPIYPELKALLRRFHREITLASVEKVRVLEAGKLPFYGELKKQGVRAQEKLPFDCMTWFAASPEQRAPQQ